MKYFLKCLCLCLIFFLPLTTHAKITGEVILGHPSHWSELWIANINNADKTRLLFRHEIRFGGILGISAQKNGPLITIIDTSDEKFFETEVYLIIVNPVITYTLL